MHHFELNERLQTALVDRLDQEQRPAEDIQAELLAAGARVPAWGGSAEGRV